MTDRPAVVLLEYYAVSGRLLLCWAWRGGEAAPRLLSVPAELDALEALVARAPWSAAAPDPECDALLAALAEPIVAVARDEDLLWIVPWGPMHQLPLHAAKLPDGRALIERHPVCYSPSASVMKLCRSRRRERCEHAVVLGDAASDLDEARAEASVVAARFGTQALVGEAATVTALDDALAAAGDDLDVLHLACHGAFDADAPERSGLQLAPDARGDGWLGGDDVQRRRVPASLVVLSACVSGRTRVQHGDEPNGLVRGFLAAGAATVVASLWRVDDLATRLLVEAFYAELQKPGARWRKAQALRRAMLAMRSLTLADALRPLGEAERTRLSARAAAAGLGPAAKPFAASRHWAPFALVGDWG